MMQSIARSITSFSKSEIQNLFVKAKRVFQANGVKILYDNSQKDFSRILVIASGKSGNAIQRNLFKRRLKSIFYQEKMYQNSKDLVVIVNKNGINLSFEKLKIILFSVSNKLKSEEFQIK